MENTLTLAAIYGLIGVLRTYGSERMGRTGALNLGLLALYEVNRENFPANVRFPIVIQILTISFLTRSDWRQIAS